MEFDLLLVSLLWFLAIVNVFMGVFLSPVHFLTMCGVQERIERDRGSKALGRGHYKSFKLNLNRQFFFTAFWIRLLQNPMYSISTVQHFRRCTP